MPGFPVRLTVPINRTDAEPAITVSELPASLQSEYADSAPTTAPAEQGAADTGGPVQNGAESTSVRADESIPAAEAQPMPAEDLLQAISQNTGEGGDGSSAPAEEPEASVEPQSPSNVDRATDDGGSADQPPPQPAQRYDDSRTGGLGPLMEAPEENEEEDNSTAQSGSEAQHGAATVLQAVAKGFVVRRAIGNGRMQGKAIVPCSW